MVTAEILVTNDSTRKSSVVFQEQINGVVSLLNQGFVFACAIEQRRIAQA